MPPLSRAWASVVAVVPKLLAAGLVMGVAVVIATLVNRALVFFFRRRVSGKTLENGRSNPASATAGVPLDGRA
ncbi:MAG: mechanosensitive ion channel family protein [Pseudorhizobium sp.]